MGPRMKPSYLAHLGATTRRVLPWLGGRSVVAQDGCRFRLEGAFPPERGWWQMKITGRCAVVEGPADPVELRGEPRKVILVHGRMVLPDFVFSVARGNVTLGQMLEQCPEVMFLPKELAEVHVLPVKVVHWGARISGVYLYLEPDLFARDVSDIVNAYEDRAVTVRTPGSTPHDRAVLHALNLLRTAQEARAEAERQRLAEEARAAEVAEAMRQGGTAEGRRALALVDMAAAAQRALQLSGAELLDAHPEHGTGAWIVRWRWQGLRLECTVDTQLRILDAGICLTDHDTGYSSDRELTLESLPSVVAEAERRGVLHRWR